MHSTTLYYPLVATPMIAPTKAYDGLPALTPREAADWMVTAARTRPVRIAPRMAVTARALDTVAPGLVNALMKRHTIHARGGVLEPASPRAPRTPTVFRPIHRARRLTLSGRQAYALAAPA